MISFESRPRVARPARHRSAAAPATGWPLARYAWRWLGAVSVASGLLALAGDAAADTCPSVRSGYQVGAQVVYVQEDRASNPVTRLERWVSDADPKSFETLQPPNRVVGPCAGQRVEFGRDRSRVFYRWETVIGADPGSYVFIDDHYARDKSAVYSKSRRLTTRLRHFRVMGGYATDGQKHFYRDLLVPGDGFALLGSAAQASRGYARTSAGVFHDGLLLRGVDAQSFELFKPELGITRDKRAVYFNDQAIAGADPGSFRQVFAATFKDERGVYTEGRRIDGLNAATVRASEFGGYLVDDRAVFRGGQPLPGRDPATFAELQHPWSRDKGAVYHRDRPVPGIDPASFRTTALDRGEDRNYRYDGLRRSCKFRAEDPMDLPVCR